MRRAMSCRLFEVIYGRKISASVDSSISIKPTNVDSLLLFGFESTALLVYVSGAFFLVSCQ